MGTRTITFCDCCGTERDMSDGLPWITGTICTDGGSSPAMQSSGMYCSLKCVHDHIGAFIKKMGIEPPVVIWPDGSKLPAVRPAL